MAVKNAVAKNWTLAASFDGYRYSAYPNGDKPSGFQTTPTLLDTDIVSGSLTGFENNKGCYLRLFGYSFGRQANLGTASGARVYLRDPLGDNAWHEVDNYRALNKSRVWTRLQVMRIIVQVGSLGGGMVNGRALDVKVTVNGVDTNILTGQFTIQPGDCYYVSPTGDDATGVKNDITKPFRYWQYSTSGGGNAYSGIFGAGNLQAGDTICGLAGTWSDNLGFDLRCLRFRSHTGTAPNGTVGNGYIHLTGYPGTAGANSPATVKYENPTNGRGFIFGVNQAYDGTYGQYISVSGLWGQMNATNVTDAAPFNLAYGANTWRVMDNECGPWSTTLDSLAAGITGQGNGAKIKFNYIHDIGGHPTNLQNHGMYFDSNGTTSLGTRNYDVAYNWLYNCYGGSGIQFFDTGGYLHQSNTVHHNYIDTCGKYGINAADSVETMDIYNNVVCNTQKHGIRLNYTTTASTLLRVLYNTIYNCQLVAGGANGAIENDGAATGTSSIVIKHNTIAFPAGRANTAYAAFYGNNGTDTNVTLEENLYYDAAGTLLTRPAKDTTYGIIGNPNFTAASTGDFTVTAGGAGLNAVTRSDPFTVSTDIYGITRPVSTANDIGATEGIGT